MSDPFARLLRVPALATALNLQQRVLADFHRRAGRVLEGRCRLRPYEETALSLERNLFSTLFLSTERQAGVPAVRLPFLGLVNQCMRAWVTSCDNLLDHEFKSVLPFDLPHGGWHFASVLTIMTADRVLFDLLLEERDAGQLSSAEAQHLSHRTLGALTRSGLQEHEEELGAPCILPVGELLERVHVPKTGLLFEAPIAAAEVLCALAPARTARARAGLRAFGLACQVLDDIADFEDDLRRSRHNLVLSLAVEAGCGRASITWAKLRAHLPTLPFEEAKSEAGEHAFRLFQDARVHLRAVGLDFSDEEWEALLSAVRACLRGLPARTPLMGCRP